MSKNLTWTEAIKKVLSESPTPMHYSELTDRIIKQGLRTSLGATPAQSVNATISESIKHEGDKSPYLRVSRGVFALRIKPSGVTVSSEKLTPEVAESEEIEAQYE